MRVNAAQVPTLRFTFVFISYNGAHLRPPLRAANESAWSLFCRKWIERVEWIEWMKLVGRSYVIHYYHFNFDCNFFGGHLSFFVWLATMRWLALRRWATRWRELLFIFYRNIESLRARIVSQSIHYGFCRHHGINWHLSTDRCSMYAKQYRKIRFQLLLSVVSAFRSLIFSWHIWWGAGHFGSFSIQNSTNLKRTKARNTFLHASI